MGPSLLKRLVGFLRRLWVGYWTYQMHRATVRMLQALDDRMLQDIGFTRREVDTAARRLPYLARWG
ncbi:MAG: DUF1127 domain-containing protein [Rhodospirillales bacterium]|nr:DUF1127 domain-containing protein [Rhodospirillales bacterium]